MNLFSAIFAVITLVLIARMGLPLLARIPAPILWLGVGYLGYRAYAKLKERPKQSSSQTDIIDLCPKCGEVLNSNHRC